MASGSGQVHPNIRLSFLGLKMETLVYKIILNSAMLTLNLKVVSSVPVQWNQHVVIEVS